MRIDESPPFVCVVSSPQNAFIAAEVYPTLNQLEVPYFSGSQVQRLTGIYLVCSV